MILINSKEFRANQKKYLDLALEEQVFVKRGKNTFIVTRADDKKVATEEYLNPDADFYRAITMDELFERVADDIHQIFNVNKCE